MSLKRELLRGSALLSAQTALSQGLRLIRAVVIARILSPEDFGIAATLWLATALLEMMSDLGLERKIVQAKEGDDERFGATAHLVLLTRGLLLVAILFPLAGPLSLMFEVPQARSAFALVALLPLLAGLNHYDIVRLQRHLRFGPFVKCQLGPDLAVTLVAWPVALWLRSYWAIVFMETVRVLLRLVLSHLVAERRYRLAYDRDILVGFLHFGWPLLINGLLMYGIFQGDRLVIALGYDMTELGFYSVAFSLAMAPTMMVVGVNSRLLLPVLSELQDDRPRFERLYRQNMILLCAAASLLGGMFVILGPWLILMVYGSRYAPAGVIVAWLGAMQAVRLLRVGATLAVMALGDTRNSMVANAFRSLGLGLALVVALHGWPLYWIAAAALIGEAIALVVAVAWGYRYHRLSPGICCRPAVVMVCGIGLASLAAQSSFVQSNWLACAALYMALAVVLLAAMVTVFEDCRRVCQDSWCAVLKLVHARWAT